MNKSKQYKVFYKNYKQYDKKCGTYHNHKRVMSTLPVQMLKTIGVDETEPYITIEIDEQNNCLIIKKDEN